MSALRVQIAIIEEELAEYEYLKEGLTKVFEANSLDELGELVTRARIARGWSQAELAKILEMEPQQIQRYERNDWQKISLWRLQEVVEALELDVAIHARSHDHESQSTEPSQTISRYGDLYPSSISSLGLGVGETLGGLDVSVGEALGNVSIGTGRVFGALPMVISDVAHGGKRAMLDAAFGMSHTAHIDTQTMLEGDWDASGGAPVLHLVPRRATTQQRIGAPVVTPWREPEAI
jgi:transcriptional regulator with XRE-family HTH domain